MPAAAPARQSGSGNINDTVNLPAGGSVTYTASCTIAAAATGTLSNTATVTAPAGVTDPTPGNNSATDTDTLGASADLAITKTDGVTTATPGGTVTYTITASNAGPSNATGATVADTFPASLTCTWTCVGAGGGTCTASGTGNINDTVNLPAGGSVTYTASCTISAAATGTLSNTATVTAPAGVTDPTPGNNSATDTDTLAAALAASVSGTKTVAGSFAPGSTVTYTITLNNGGTGYAGRQSRQRVHRRAARRADARLRAPRLAQLVLFDQRKELVDPPLGARIGLLGHQRVELVERGEVLAVVVDAVRVEQVRHGGPP